MRPDILRAAAAILIGSFPPGIATGADEGKIDVLVVLLRAAIALAAILDIWAAAGPLTGVGGKELRLISVTGGGGLDPDNAAAAAAVL